MCRPTYNLYQYTWLNWQEEKLKTKPISYKENNVLDEIYQYSNPVINPPVFRILFLSDIELDFNYKVNSSVECYDESCCHDIVEDLPNNLKAPKYGSKKCNMPLDGFKKMIDTINKLNDTSYLSFMSLIYAGNSNAFIPEYLTEA